MRHLPHTEKDISEMLSVIAAKSVTDLFSHIPQEIRTDAELNLSAGMDEIDLTRNLSKLASSNKGPSASFLGAGAYRHYVPACVSELASRTEFVTPYTPYQPEISQGTLQVLFEYQTMIARIFGMDVSNASHYSGATALADACLMARRIGKKKTKIVIADTVHPQYRDVLKTVLCGNEDLTTVPCPNGIIDQKALAEALDENVAAVVAGYPNFFGIVEDLKNVGEMAHSKGSLFITATPEPMALGILTPPGEFGADIAVGEGLSFGLPLSFGGPTLGIFTTTEKLVRNMPGRVCGKTVDALQRTAYTLTLSTREQHIRREKATSNICSNQALCATTATIYLSLIGREGFKNLSLQNASKAGYAAKTITKTGKARLAFKNPFFNEFVIECETNARDVLEKLSSHDVSGGVALSSWYPDMKNHILVCVTEMNTKDEIDLYSDALTRL
jgi:glycine dehydrogenase subunit 1